MYPLLSSKKLRPMTLIYLHAGGKVLLLKRNPDKAMVPGKWLGLGGKIEPGEGNIFASAQREFLEETGATLKDPILRGTFLGISEKEHADLLYIFTAPAYEGNISDFCDEGELQWHDILALENLSGFAEHQKLFLLKILTDSTFFYSGIAVYEQGKLVDYTDNSQYFAERAQRTSKPL